MKHKLEIANKIIKLDKEKIELESKISFLKRELPEKSYSSDSRMEIHLKNGHNGGYTSIWVNENRDALMIVNKTLLEYVNSRILEIDELLNKITIQDEKQTT